MKIESSAINLSSQHFKIEKQETKESLTLWTGASEPQDTVELSAESRKNFIFSSLETNPVCTEDYLELEVSDEDKLKIKLIESFVENMTGKKIKIRLPKIKINQPKGTETNLQIRQSADEPRLGWGLIYDYSKTRYEKETISFSAQGIVKTQDGREIKIDLELNMTREFMEHHEIHLRAGDAKKIDPLVINYAGNLPGLTETKFSFDLDADGIPDQVSFVKENSGFLALDLNGDGVINDGTELFGPQSGDGFSELAAYDEDGNGWIDENDPIYYRLRIWTKDAQGNDYLFALGDLGVGAIYLGNASTLFSLNNRENQLLGEIQKTGLFLRENGSCGTIQHIDLAV